MDDFYIENLDLLGDIDLWHLAEELNVVQASLLLLKLNPADYDRIENCSKKPSGYEAVSTAIENAILADKLEAKKDFYQNFDAVSLNRYDTKINVENLCNWLKQRNFTDNFFFNDSQKVRYYLDSSNPYYAPKLHALIEASEAVTSDPSLLEGKTPKQAIDKWLRQNAGRFNLTDDDGNPNNSAIEEMSKIGNWKPEGGASKTPTGKIKTTLGKQETPTHVSKNLPTH